MTVRERIQEGDKVLDTQTVGSATSLPEGTKVVFYVHRGTKYLVEEQTALSYRSCLFDSEHRKRDSQRAYKRATLTTELTLRKEQVT